MIDEELRLTQPPPELGPLIARNALVRACWQHFRLGDISYEKCLLLMVTELAKQNDSLAAEVVRCRSAGPVFFSAGDPESP